MEILLIAVTGLMNIICFFIGAKVGQKVVKEEEIKAPNPVKVVEAYQEHKEEKEAKKELETNLENINKYDGTALGQKSFD